MHEIATDANDVEAVQEPTQHRYGGERGAGLVTLPPPAGHLVGDDDQGGRDRYPDDVGTRKVTEVDQTLVPVRGRGFLG